MNAKCCRRFKIFQANAKSVFFWYFKCESAFNILLLLRQKLPKTDKPLSYPVSDKNMYMNMIPSIFSENCFDVYPQIQPACYGPCPRSS